ncbi:hypothetical protein QNI16_15345 [Cytophagaceae bacterium YF14B1]|uniref:Uncharacterized protein n=1 Tax=Xanthocytophaga flava TaxID=3048013 RepID=A0AAE3QMS1_9BACT|nr:hypothetical protein [Xanthocytophaga flavus]MDJ1481875.1 hypothetical protein [Xanthocytophaga flavus]
MSKENKRINLTFTPFEFKRFCEYVGVDPTCERGIATEAKRIIKLAIRKKTE